VHILCTYSSNSRIVEAFGFEVASALARKDTPSVRLSSDLKLSFGFPCVLGVGGETLSSG
jgi:hypothetical protein